MRIFITAGGTVNAQSLIKAFRAVNFGSLMLDLAQGKPIADRRGTHLAGLTMLRYWQEVYEDANGEVTVDDASFRAVVG